MQGFYLIMPRDPKMRDILEQVDLGTRRKLMTDYKANLNSGYLTTIACVYYESMVRCLVKLMTDTKDDHAAINFFDLFAVEATTRVNEDADKEGNINVKFVVGPATKMLVDTGMIPNIEPRMWEKTILADIQKNAANVLYTKHRMSVPKADNNNIYTVIAYVYFEFLIRTLVMMIRSNDGEKERNSAMINFLDLFEMHISRLKNIMKEEPVEVQEEQNEEPQVTREKAEIIDVKIRPGMTAKLIIKDDHTTEANGDDDE